jgi:hypothetical protein
VVRIDVHKDRLIVRFKSAGTEESHSTDGQLLSIPWQKPPSRRSRQILIPLGIHFDVETLSHVTARRHTDAVDVVLTGASYEAHGCQDNRMASTRRIPPCPLIAGA